MAPFRGSANTDAHLRRDLLVRLSGVGADAWTSRLNAHPASQQEPWYEPFSNDPSGGRVTRGELSESPYGCPSFVRLKVVLCARHESQRCGPMRIRNVLAIPTRSALT